MLLWEFIATEREALIGRWMEEVRKSISADSVPAMELIDEIPLFVDEMIAALRRDAGIPARSPLPDKSPSAGNHGVDRLRLGFDIQEVVREYEILRDCVLALMEEAGTSVSIWEFRTLSRCIGTGNAEAIRQFARNRDAQLQKQAAEHFSFLAHDLRNTLSSAQVALEVLRKTETIANPRALNAAERSLTAAGTMIHSALGQMRDRATMDPRLESINLKDLLSKIECESATHAEAKGIALKFELTEPLELRADRRLLQSAISNLLGNALKFTPLDGRVALRAFRREANIIVEVEDECGGLPSDKASKLFNPYVQVGIDRSGFGLGLAIAKHAAEAHSGSIEAGDIPGKGCVFRLKLPLSNPAGNPLIA